MKQLVFCLLVSVCSISNVNAQQQASYGKWLTQKHQNISEAYTANDLNSVFGVFCLRDQCLFYLHQSLQCEPNKKYSLLMNSQVGSSAITMRCAVVGQQLFWILEPFKAVLRAIQSGDHVGFAISLQSGAFAISRFDLDGAMTAVRATLLEAAIHSENKAPQVPKQPPPAPRIINPNSNSPTI